MLRMTAVLLALQVNRPKFRYQMCGARLWPVETASFRNKPRTRPHRFRKRAAPRTELAACPITSPPPPRLDILRFPGQYLATDWTALPQAARVTGQSGYSGPISPQCGSAPQANSAETLLAPAKVAIRSRRSRCTPRCPLPLLVWRLVRGQADRVKLQCPVPWHHREYRVRSEWYLPATPR